MSESEQLLIRVLMDGGFQTEAEARQMLGLPAARPQYPSDPHPGNPPETPPADRESRSRPRH